MSLTYVLVALSKCSLGGSCQEAVRRAFFCALASSIFAVIRKCAHSEVTPWLQWKRIWSSARNSSTLCEPIITCAPGSNLQTCSRDMTACLRHACTISQKSFGVSGARDKKISKLFHSMNERGIPKQKTSTCPASWNGSLHLHCKRLCLCRLSLSPRGLLQHPELKHRILVLGSHAATSAGEIS